VFHALLAIVRGRGRAPSFLPEGGRYGLPGDFLIAPSGKVLASKYGTYVDDQWSADDVLAWQESGRKSSPNTEPTAPRGERAR
jgi:hypothetical protein